jgi:hypothetical protein
MFALYNQFLQGEPLTNGHYGDVGTDTGVITVTNASGSVRAWGKIDVLNGRGILWIDNANDTWQNVANGASIAPTSATLTLGGLPNGTYDVSWYDTTSGAVATNTPTVSNGRLALTVSALQHDVAVKFKKY